MNEKLKPPAVHDIFLILLILIILSLYSEAKMSNLENATAVAATATATATATSEYHVHFIDPSCESQPAIIISTAPAQLDARMTQKTKTFWTSSSNRPELVILNDKRLGCIQRLVTGLAPNTRDVVLIVTSIRCDENLLFQYFERIKCRLYDAAAASSSRTNWHTLLFELYRMTTREDHHPSLI